MNRSQTVRLVLGAAMATCMQRAPAVDFFGYMYARQADSTSYRSVDVNLMEIDHNDLDSLRRNGQAGIKAWVNGWFEQYFSPPDGCAALPDARAFDAWVAKLKSQNLAGYLGVVYMDEPSYKLFIMKNSAGNGPKCPDPAHPQTASYAVAGSYINMVIAHVKQAFLPFTPPVGMVEAKPALVDSRFAAFPSKADWVGFDWYPSTTNFQAEYRGYLNQLLAKMDASHQRIIFVPQAEFNFSASPRLSEADVDSVTDSFLQMLQPGQSPDISRKVVAVLPFFGGKNASYVDHRGVTWTSSLTYDSVERRYKAFAHSHVPQVAARYNAAMQAMSPAASAR